MLDIGGRYVFVGELDVRRPHVVLAVDLKSPDPHNQFRVMKRVHLKGFQKVGSEVINESVAMKLMSGKKGFLTFYEMHHQTVDDSFWIVMECAEGGSVLDYLVNFPALHRSLSEPIKDNEQEGSAEVVMSHSARKNRLRAVIAPRLRRILKRKEKEKEIESSEMDDTTTMNLSPDVSDENLTVDYRTSDDTILIDGDWDKGVISKHVSQSVVFTIFLTMAHSVRRLHEENLAHMDIKLDNFFMRKDPTDICLGDFGFVALYKKGFVHDAAKGTIMYAAPEVFNGPYNPQKADIWSLGVCLYVMVKNAIPFDGKTPGDTRHAIVTKEPVLGNSLVDDLLRSILTKDTDKRPVINEVLSHPWMQQTPLKRLPVGPLSVIQEMMKDYLV